MLKTIKILLLFLLITPFSQAQNSRKCEEDLIPKYDKQKRMWGFSNLFGQWVLEPIYTKVTPFTEDKAVVQKGLSYGVIGCDGTVIIPNTFQNMTSYRSGKIWACKNKLWGVLDDKGRTLLEFQYSEINPILHTSLTWVKKENLWGLFDEEKGRLLCKPQYPMATTMSQNASLVKVNDYFGVINHVNCTYLIAAEISKVKKVAPHIIVFNQNGKWGLFNEFGILRLNPIFDSLYMKFPETVVGIKDQKYGLFDLSGKETLPVIYDNFGEISEGLFSIKQNNKFGYATRQGKVIVKCEYQEASLFKNKLAVVRNNNLYGVIDYTNKTKLPFKYESILRNSSSGEFATKESGKPYTLWASDLSKQYAITFDSISITDNGQSTRVKNGNKVSFINLAQGKKIFDRQFDTAESFNGNYSKVVDDKNWGVINLAGKDILPLQYDSIVDNKWGNKPLWTTWKSGKCGIYDTTGKQLLVNEFDSIQYLGDGILKAKKNQSWGLIKSNGVAITEYEFAAIYTNDIISSWPAIVLKHNQYGLISENGKYVLEPNFELIHNIGNNLFSIKKGKQCKIYNSKGEIVSKKGYDKIGRMSNSLISVQKNDKWGYVNSLGIEVIPIQFQEVKDCEDNFCIVQSNSKWGTIDKKGKIKTPLDYDNFEDKNGKLFLTKNGLSFLIDQYGNISLKN